MSLISIKTYNIIHEAELAKSILEGAGIKSSIYGLGIGQGGGAGMGGIELKVEESDVEAAKQILADN